MNPLTNVRNIKKLSDQELTKGLKTSWHDQYKDSAWIYIGGLPFELTEGDIICVFSQYGEIVNVNLVREKDTGKSKGFCFICYDDQRSTVLAVDNFNGIKILGRTLRVDHVTNYKMPKDSKHVDDETRKLREEGCAPRLEPASQEVQIIDEIEPVVVKKEKKDKKKKKKKKKRREEKQMKSSGSSEEENSSGSESEEVRKRKRKRKRKKSESESDSEEVERVKKKKKKKKRQKESDVSSSESEEERASKVKTKKRRVTLSEEDSDKEDIKIKVKDIKQEKIKRERSEERGSKREGKHNRKGEHRTRH